MKRERMLILILCLLALPAGSVHVVAQEKQQTDAEAKRAVEAEQLKAKRALQADQIKARRAVQTEQMKAKRAAQIEQLKARRATEKEQLKAKRAIAAEQLKVKRAVGVEQLKRKRAADAKRREMPLDGTFKLLSSKFNAHGRLVKGAPYSAIAVTESKHSLSDGNQIIHRDEAAYYRDTEGRTRIEQTLKKIGKWVADGNPKRIVMIADPIAGYSYYLDASDRKATKAPFVHRGGDPAARLKETVQRQKLALEKQKQTFDEQRAKQRQLFDEHWEKRRRALEEQRSEAGQTSQTSQEQWAKEKQMFEEQRAKQKQAFDEQFAKRKQLFDEQLARRKQGLEGSMSKLYPEKSLVSSTASSSTEEKRTVAGPQSARGKKTESLGKQVVEGVEAEGTRTTLTIPAGEIGNTLPIYVVDESWYSRELQMPLMTRHHDPRSGDTVFRLTNIRRTEPARSLFEVPADYTIVENTRAKFSTTIRGPKPAGVKIDTKRANPDSPKPPTPPLVPVKTTSPTSE